MKTILTIHPPEEAALTVPEPLEIPMVDSGVSAGFPSPAEDFLQQSLDLNRALIKHPSATFFVRVAGDSMNGDQINDGDLLVVDRAVEPYHGCVAVCFLDGEFTLKRVDMQGERVLLVPSNPRYKTIEITAEDDFTVWGVVSYVIKKM